MKVIVLFGIAAFILQFVVVKVHCNDEDQEVEVHCNDEDQEVELDENELMCIDVTKVDKSVVLHAKKAYRVPANIPVYKEFLSCCWKLYGYQADDGTLEWDKIRDVLENAYPPKRANALVKKCDDVKGQTEGDTVALALRCLDDHAPNMRNVHWYYTGSHGTHG